MLFDVDGTLVTGRSSERGFMEFLFRRGRFGVRQALATLTFISRWLPRFGRDIFKKNKAYLAGLGVEEVARLADIYVDRELMNRLHPPSAARLRQHVAAGDDVVLLTGTPDFIARPLASRLGVDTIESSRCPRSDGRYPGGPPIEHPFGSAKLDYALELARTRSRRIEDAMAYADSRDDLALMRAVGVAVAVRPDSRLREEAVRQGWEIIE
ncbi:HAD family hydrolase [soil metagenome]